MRYRFNYSKNDHGKIVSGYAWGSVTSESLNYTKYLLLGSDGFLTWCLSPDDTDLSFKDRIII